MKKSLKIVEELNNMNIDIITPTLNSESFIEVCLLSTKKLREKSVVHLLVDSYSTDRTVEIASRHNVSVVDCPPGNMYQAINLGIANTASEWVTYINSDDMLFSDGVFDAFMSYNDCSDVIYGNVDYVDSNGRFLHHWRSASPKTLLKLFASGFMPFPQQGTIFRRSLWEKLGGFQEKYKYSADFDFFLRALMSGARFGYYTKDPVAAFRLHGQQISQNFSDAMVVEVEKAVSESSIEIPQYEKYHSKLQVRFQNIPSYLMRLLRHHHLYGCWSFARTISSR